MSIKGQGFASLPKGKHKRLSSKGGSRKVRKGFGTLSPEDRIVIAVKGSDARWEKARREKQEQKQPINSAEDGRVKDKELP